LPTIVMPFERVRTSARATVLVQPRGPTSCCLPGEPLVCRPWCWQQDAVCICSGATRLRARQQDLPPSVDEQQVPPQQHPEAAREILRQNGLTWPSGHRQSKWGTAVTSVMTAVSHAWPIQAFLPKERIIIHFLNPLCPLRPRPTMPTIDAGMPMEFFRRFAKPRRLHAVFKDKPLLSGNDDQVGTHHWLVSLAGVDDE